MGEGEEKNPNPMYIVFDLVEDIFLRLPLKSTFKLITVSKQWKSTLESRTFVEKRVTFQKNRKILSAIESEIEMVYLECDDSITQCSFTCDVWFASRYKGWVEIHPSTGPILSFLSVPCRYWVMGFGKDKVNGSYKVVRMLYDDPNRWLILDVNIRGYWRKLSPPPYKIEPTCKSVCVNGSIYRLNVCHRYNKILALDLHTEEFSDVSVPRSWISNIVRRVEGQIPNILLTSTLVSLTILGLRSIYP